MKEGYIKERYRQLKEMGICPDCGREAVTGKYVHCAECRAERREQARRSRLRKGIKTREERNSGEYCCMCLKPLKDEEKARYARLCSECYQKVCCNLAKGREKKVKNNEKHN